MAKAVRTMVGVVVALALGMPASDAASAPDLTVYHVGARVFGVPATTLRDQDGVTFRAFVKNRGPGTTQDMYAMYTNTRRLYIASEECIIPPSESGDFSDTSPDTPSCEWTNVPEGDYAIVRVEAYAVGLPGQHVRITFCSSNGQATGDPDPGNDCQTKRLTIVSG